MNLKIGELKLKNPLMLAPMVDVTDLPFRLLCRRAGAAMCYTEMVYVDALLHENASTLRMVKTCAADKPLGLQITGNSIEEFEEFVSRRKLWEKFELIDLNCGCPSTRIVGTKAGSYLLKEPEKIAMIIRILKQTGKPVTAKIRLGYLKNNVLEIARMIEGAGADALTVHARLSNEPYAKKADWDWIGRVKREVGIPVIGNGDVFSGKDAEEILNICDGVMVARGAIGDPLVFRRILNYLTDGKKYVTNHPEPRGASVRENWGMDWKENLKQFEEYLKLEKKYFGSNVDLGKIKYVGGKFLRGFTGASKKRDGFMKLKNWGEIEKFVEDLRKSLG